MGAAQVSVALKSGANAFHGALREFLRNDALQPSNPRFHTNPPLKQNQFAVAIGGPVWIPKLYNGKNQTFFYFSYQRGRRRTGSIGQGQVPTAQERTGDFSAWPTQLYDPLTTVLSPDKSVTRTPFPGNQIPSSRFASQSSNLLPYFPQPTSTCALPCTTSLAALPRRPTPTDTAAASTKISATPTACSDKSCNTTSTLRYRR